MFFFNLESNATKNGTEELRLLLYKTYDFVSLKLIIILVVVNFRKLLLPIQENSL